MIRMVASARFSPFFLPGECRQRANFKRFRVSAHYVGASLKTSQVSVLLQLVMADDG